MPDHPNRPVFLDMDPGIDDAHALFVALGRLPIRGLAAVAGNVEIEKTFRNTKRLLAALGRADLPVWRGSSAPLKAPFVSAASVHGLSGLDGWTFDESEEPSHTDVPWHAWPQLFQELNSLVHLIATGPLTNVAKLLWCLPDATACLSGITLMGGAVHSGNVTPSAEFNFYVDPDAADVVMAAPVPVQMIGLDVTHKARMPWEMLPRLLEYGYPGQILHGVLTWYGHHGEKHPEGLAIHDAVAVVAYARPDLFRWEQMKLMVLAEGPWRGTVVRLPDTADRSCVSVAVDVDVNGVLDWLWAALGDLVGHSANL